MESKEYKNVWVSPDKQVMMFLFNNGTVKGAYYTDGRNAISTMLWTEATHKL